MSTAAPAWHGDALRSLPDPILRKMRQMIRRVRRINLIKGWLAVLATALVCLLAMMAVDAAVTLFSPAARWTLTLSGFAVTAVAAWWWVVRPATRRITLASIARFVEERHPELQETLSSAIELLSSDDPDEIRGSRELIAEVVKVAEREAAMVSPSREVDASAIRRHAVTALTFASVLGLVFIFWPSPAKRLVLRAVAPFMEVGNAYADSLTVEPGDVRVPLGTALEIKASVKHPRLQRATVRRLDPGSKDEGVERMIYRETEGSRREFVFTIPNVTQDFTYRVHAGPALSRSFQVTAVAPPTLESLAIRVEPPAYTGLAASEGVWDGKEITALEHANVTFRARSSRETAKAELHVGDKLVPAEPADASQELVWIHTARRGADTTWRIGLEDAEGFSSEPTQGSLRVTTDQAPTVRITSPEAKELRLLPHELLPMAYAATEDFGFTRAELVVEPDNGDKPVVISLERPARVARDAEWFGQASLDLSGLKLERARSLKVRVRVADNLPEFLKGPQVAESEPLLIRLENGAKPLAQQVVESQREEMKRGLEEVRRDLQDARNQHEQLRRELQQPTGLSPKALQRLDDTRKEVTAAETRLEELARKMESTLFQEPARRMGEIADESVRPAREAAEMIPLSDTREDRLARAEEVSAKLEEAMKQVADVAKELEAASETAEQVAELSAVAQEQARLAREAEELAREEAAREAQPPEAAAATQKLAEREMEAWQREQQAVEARLAELLKESPEALREVLQEQQEEAARLAERSEALAERQAALEKAAAQAANPDPKAAAKALAQEVMRGLQAEQADIARQAGQAKQDAEKAKTESAPEFRALLSDAAKAAAEAAKQLQRQSVSAAEAAAEKAGAALEQSAEASARAAAKEAAAELAEDTMQAAIPAERAADPAMREAVAEAAQEIAETAAMAPAGAVTPEALAKAVQEASQPLADPARATPEAVAAAAEQASRALAQTAPSEGAKPAPKAPADARAALEMAELADRQRGVAAALQALEKGQTEEALSMLQEAVTGQAEELMAESAAMERNAALTRQNQAQSWADQAEKQFTQASAQSRAATQALRQAQAQQDQGQAAQARQADPSLSSQEAMAKAESGQLPAAAASPGEMNSLQQARQAQQRAREALTQAAQRMEQTGQSLAQAAKQTPAPGPNQQAPEGSPMAPEQLAQGFQEASQAARAAQSGEAAARASQAAQSLQQMATAAARSLGAMSDLAGPPPAPVNAPSDQAQGAPGEKAGEMKRGQDAANDGVPPELAKLGVSAADWARMKGSLRPDITSQASSGAPQEYRDLVSDYFRIIATEAKK